MSKIIDLTLFKKDRSKSELSELVRECLVYNCKKIADQIVECDNKVTLEIIDEGNKIILRSRGLK